MSVNVRAMNDGLFLFELPSRKRAEHVLNGVWEWRKTRMVLEWWKPTSGCWPAEINRDWIWVRLLGLPLNLWSQEILKQIEDQCGGFIETEEETMLKNHLHWARIKVKGDGKLVPTEDRGNQRWTCVQFQYGWKHLSLSVQPGRRKKN